MTISQEMKDFWGNDALDYGSLIDLQIKYRDKVFLFVTNQPLGDGYVIAVAENDEEDMLYKQLENFNRAMKDKGIMAYGAGVNWGHDIQSMRAPGFLGGYNV
jgi:hypothetical protein